MNKVYSGSQRKVAVWIFAGVVMLVIQVILGGITRLTGSGLSITEWNIVTGTLPPLSEQQWLVEFNKYRNTPQYLLLNTDFSLKDFKYIFFWEWFHRLWARLIAISFLLPFLYFLFKKSFKKEMVIPLIILFLLGALQGAVGWIMVASGLVGDAVYVRPTRLALHFIFAMLLIAYAFWFALRLTVPAEQVKRNSTLNRWAIVILLVLVVQFMYGALMAGHKAAAAAPTFPDINGSWIPASIGQYKPLVLNLIENKITIHFIHRNLGYVLIALTILWTAFAVKWKISTPFFTNTRWIPLILIVLQALLGMVTVITSPSVVPNEWNLFQWLAALHQVTGMLFMLAVIWMIYLTRTVKPYI